MLPDLGSDSGSYWPWLFAVVVGLVALGFAIPTTAVAVWLSGLVVGLGAVVLGILIARGH